MRFGSSLGPNEECVYDLRIRGWKAKRREEVWCMITAQEKETHRNIGEDEVRR